MFFILIVFIKYVHLKLLLEQNYQFRITMQYSFIIKSYCGHYNHAHERVRRSSGWARQPYLKNCQVLPLWHASFANSARIRSAPDRFAPLGHPSPVTSLPGHRLRLPGARSVSETGHLLESVERLRLADIDQYALPSHPRVQTLYVLTRNRHPGKIYLEVIFKYNYSNPKQLVGNFTT